jgi:thiamine biosynthesis protein ThiC
MKPFNAGQLLDAAKSPFHKALTPDESVGKCVYCKRCPFKVCQMERMQEIRDYFGK